MTDVPFATDGDAVRASERRLRLALDTAAMGVLEVNLSTGEAIVSEHVPRLLGYEPGEAATSLEWLLSHVHADDRFAVRRGVDPVTSEEWLTEAQFRVVRRDGAVRWWNRRAAVSEGHDGARLVVVVADITERRLLEEKAREAHKLEAIGQLAGGIAHDFNNLLTVIAGYSETMLAVLTPAHPLAHDVVEIRRAAERAALLTQQLLAFSRRQFLRPTLVDACDVVRDIGAMMTRLLTGDVRLVLDIAGMPATVRVDRGQLEQVLLNLAVNARDAMPDGGSLSMAVAPVEMGEREAATLYPMPAGRYVKLSVRDTGIGMPPDVRARAFEPFFTTKPPGEGSGIGLASVYGIVKQSGGFVFAESEPGAGSTFHVYLPAAAGDVPGSAHAPSETEPPAVGTVLLVEDYRRVRELARKILTRQGYRVLDAASGEEALDICRGYGDAIDVLLTDVVMPGIRGTDLAVRVREMRPGIAVLFMSGYPGDATAVHGLTQEEAFIEKPFTPTSLADKVREVLERSSARRALARYARDRRQ
jgi:two-component system, cell cycle sensor histidine kinase and response regulator CckA